MSDGTLVAKTFFNFAASVVVDLLELRSDTALLLKQAFDTADIAF